MIRNKYNKIIAVLVATFLIGSTFVGCTNSSTSSKVSATNVSVGQTKETTVLGKVKSIDGSKITISLGEEVTTSTSETTNGNTQNTQGQTSAPEKPAGEGNTQSNNSTPPAKPDGEASTNGNSQTSEQGGTSNGNPPIPSQGGGAPGMGNTSTTSFKSSGEEKNY
jgi:cytoskeletal protein RodZ